MFKHDQKDKLENVPNLGVIVSSFSLGPSHTRILPSLRLWLGQAETRIQVQVYDYEKWGSKFSYTVVSFRDTSILLAWVLVLLSISRDHSIRLWGTQAQGAACPLSLARPHGQVSRCRGRGGHCQSRSPGDRDRDGHCQWVTVVPASGILYTWYKAVHDGMYWYVPVRTLLGTWRYEKPQNGTYQYVPT